MQKNKKTTEQFKKEVYNLVGDEYTITGEYKGSNKKIEIKHNKCNNIYEVRANSFLSGTRCVKCLILSKTKNESEFFKEVYDLHKEKYTIIGKYINSHTNIKIKHNENCNFEFNVIPGNFLLGSECPKCAGNNKKTTHIFKEEIYKIIKDEYEVLGEYINSSTKIKMKHNICNFEYEVTPNKFLIGRRCPKCSGLMKKTTEQFKQEVFDLVKDEYEVLGEYINSSKNIKLIHNKCSTEYNVSPNAFQRGHRCPKCAESKGEKRISEYLDKNNIAYQREYRFDNCKNKYRLPFDFAIFNNNYLICLVEFDGAHHFGIGCFSSIKEKQDINFAYTKNNDKIKNEYCKANNIPLIRIPYFQKDILEEILDIRLKRLIKN